MSQAIRLFRRGLSIIFYALAALTIPFYVLAGFYGYIMGFNPFLVVVPALAIILLFFVIGFLLAPTTRQA